MLKKAAIASSIFVVFLQSCDQQVPQLPTDNRNGTSGLIFPNSIEPEVLKAFGVKSAEQITYPIFVNRLNEFGEMQMTMGNSAFTWCNLNGRGGTEKYVGSVSVTHFIADRPATLKFVFGSDNELACMEVFQPKQ